MAQSMSPALILFITSSSSTESDWTRNWMKTTYMARSPMANQVTQGLGGVTTAAAGTEGMPS